MCFKMAKRFRRGRLKWKKVTEERRRQTQSDDISSRDKGHAIAEESDNMDAMHHKVKERTIQI